MHTTIFKKIKPILKEIRIWQWTKNILVFIPIIFGASLLNIKTFTNVVIVFFAVSLAASTVYVINDIIDAKEDRIHPIKKKRPIASGEISIREAYLIILTTFIISFSLSLLVSINILLLIIFYIILNLLYSKYLKHKEIVDILIVAFFYIYRVYVGGVASHLPISGWLLLTTFALSLFMIIGKRRAELVTAGFKNCYSRKVLNFYNEKFLDAAFIMSLTLFVVFYSLYSVLAHNGLFVLTIFPVLFISLRYLYLIFAKNDGEEPEKIIFRDKEILVAGIILVLSIVVILYSGVSNFVKL